MIVKHVLKMINRIIPKTDKEVVFVDGRFYPDAIYALLSEYARSTNKKEFRKISVVQTQKLNPYISLPNIIFIPYGKIRFFFRVFRAKYIITDIMFGDEYLSKEQIVVNIWHGVGLKSILGLTNEYSNRKKPLATYAMSYSDYFNSIVSKCFLIQPDKVLPSGSPRNDLFYSGKKTDLNLLYPNIGDFKKIVIWMPTYRQSSKASSADDGKEYPYGIPLVDEKNIVVLDESLRSHDVFLIIKHHVLQDKQSILPVKLTNILIITSEDVLDTGISLYQLIGQCDALITDYSSIFFEYMSLDRPICYAYDDYDEYNSKRGFMFEKPKELMVGYHANTIDQLMLFVQDLARGVDIYEADRRSCIKKMNLYTDNLNSKRLLSLLHFIE